MKLTTILLAVFVFSLFTSTVFARNTEVLVDAQEAIDRQAKGGLSDMPFYLKGQKHPIIKKKLGNWRATRKGRGAFQSDLDACSRTFVTALKSLQERARREGGNAVVNIISVTKDVPFEDAEKFRCIAGGVIVHVALEGDIVVLEK